MSNAVTLESRSEVVDATKKVLQPYFDEDVLTKDEFKEIARTASRELKPPLTEAALRGDVLQRILTALKQRGDDATAVDHAIARVNAEIAAVSSGGGSGASVAVATTPHDTLSAAAAAQQQQQQHQNAAPIKPLLPSLAGLKGFLQKAAAQKPKPQPQPEPMLQPPVPSTAIPSPPLVDEPLCVGGVSRETSAANGDALEAKRARMEAVLPAPAAAPSAPSVIHGLPSVSVTHNSSLASDTHQAQKNQPSTSTGNGHGIASGVAPTAAVNGAAATKKVAATIEHDDDDIYGDLPPPPPQPAATPSNGNLAVSAARGGLLPASAAAPLPLPLQGILPPSAAPMAMGAGMLQRNVASPPPPSFAAGASILGAAAAPSIFRASPMAPVIPNAPSTMLRDGW